MLISELVDDIQRDFPDPLEGAVERAVRRAFLEFCKRSEAWRHRDGDYLVQGENQYPLLIPKGTYILATNWCRVAVPNGDIIDLTPMSFESMTPETQGRPRAFCIEGDELFISPVGVEGEYSLDVKLAPTRACVEIPDAIADRYIDTIRNGALYELLRLPGQVWSAGINRNEVNALAMTFEAGIVEARREARKDRSRPSRVATPWDSSIGHRRTSRRLY